MKNFVSVASDKQVYQLEGVNRRYDTQMKALENSEKRFTMQMQIIQQREKSWAEMSSVKSELAGGISHDGLNLIKEAEGFLRFAHRSLMFTFVTLYYLKDTAKYKCLSAMQTDLKEAIETLEK